MGAEEEGGEEARRNKEHGETLQAKEEEVESEGTLPLTPPWGARKEGRRTVEGRTMPSPAALPKEGKAASGKDGGLSFLGALSCALLGGGGGTKFHVTQSASLFGCALLLHGRRGVLGYPLSLSYFGAGVSAETEPKGGGGSVTAAALLRRRQWVEIMCGRRRGENLADRLTRWTVAVALLKFGEAREKGARQELRHRRLADKNSDPKNI
ncbi:uncharacterized protein LOC113432900 [Pseudonaja textilis]|uniref:uncharacterized protein LOC113432900 n=1 Tax=Pseudonaja textilis TaxID=8673 RepID=UPI000EA842B3|nr:uncharacterized protein LOC113432900 [Pseudonaja textilis]